MRLAAKLVLLFLSGLLLIVGLFSYITIQQGRRLAIAEHERHAADLAATLEPTISQALQQRGPEALPQFLNQATRQIRNVEVRWVEFSSSSRTSSRPTVPVERIVTKREVTTISMPDANGRPHLYTYVPVTDDVASPAGIEISAPDTDADNRLRGSVLSSLLALVGVATLSGMVIWVGGIKMVGQPLEQLIAKVHRVGRGDFSGPVQLQSNDELGRLGVALNEMCEQLAEQRSQLDSETASRIATLKQLRHADRLNSVGRMAAGIAHEIGTPLNVVSGRAELIASGQLTDEDTRSSAKTIQTETRRISNIVRNLLDFARQSSPRVSPQNLNPLIEETVRLMQPLAEKQQTNLKTKLPKNGIVASVDKAQMQQVLTNLILNAVQASPPGREVSVVLEAKPDDSEQAESNKSRSDEVVISVIDQGPGISEEELQQIFEPFYTTKDVGEGTGLGLAISHGIVQEHGGRISVDSKPGGGSQFSVILPALPEEGACE